MGLLSLLVGPDSDLLMSFNKNAGMHPEGCQPGQKQQQLPPVGLPDARFFSEIDFIRMLRLESARERAHDCVWEWEVLGEY